MSQNKASYQETHEIFTKKIKYDEPSVNVLTYISTSKERGSREVNENQPGMRISLDSPRVDNDLMKSDVVVSENIQMVEATYEQDLELSPPGVQTGTWNIKGDKDVVVSENIQMVEATYEQNLELSPPEIQTASWNIKGPTLPSWNTRVENPENKPRVCTDISGPSASPPHIDLQAEKADLTRPSHDKEWKFGLPDWKFGQEKSATNPKASADLSIEGNVESPDLDISGPRVSGADIDLKARKDHHSGSDHEGGWKFGLPDWKFGKGKSGKTPKASGDVSINGNVETSDLDISGPRVSGPDIDMKAKIGDHSDANDNEHGWKIKGPKLPHWKFGKGKSEKSPKKSGEADIDATIEVPDANISGPRVDSAEIKGSEVNISGPRVAVPEPDLKTSKGDYSDSDIDEQGCKIKGPKFPSLKRKKGKSGKTPQKSGELDLNVDVEGPDINVPRPGVDSPDVKNTDVNISGPRMESQKINFKAKAGDHTDSDSDGGKHGWKLKRPRLSSWKRKEGKSGKSPKVSGDGDIGATLKHPDMDISGPDVDSPDIKSPDLEVSGPRVSGPDLDLKAKKGDDSDSDDDERGWKFKGPKLPSWKFGKGKSGKSPKVSGDVDVDANLKGPDVEISGPGVDSPDVKGPAGAITCPRVSGPDFDLKAKKGDDSDSDDDEHGWKFKGPKLPSWKFGKGKSGKSPKVYGDVEVDANLKGPDVDISDPGVESPDIKGPDLEISGPRVSGPDFDLKAKKGDESDSDNDEHGWKFKGPKLPSWKFGKGKSGKSPKVSGDVDVDANLKGPDVDISGSGVDSPDVKGLDGEITGPRVSGPDFDLKAKKGDESDSDDDEHGWKFKGPKLPSWKFGKGKSRKSPKVSGDVEVDANLKGPDVEISGPRVECPDIKGPDLEISGPRVSGPDFDLKAKKGDESDSDDDEHGWKFKGPKLPSWKFGKGKSGKSPKVSGDVEVDANLKGPDVDISGPGVESPDIEGPDLEISGPRVSRPDLDLKAKKGDDSDSDDDEHGWKFKGPKLPSWKFGKGKSGKSPKVYGDVEVDANLKGPDVDISDPGVESPDIKGPDLEISGPRVSGPDFDLKAKKGDESDSDDDEHGWKFKGPKLPSWKFGKGQSGKSPKVSGDVEVDANLKGPDVDISGPGVESPDIKGPDLEISGPRVSGPDLDLKAKKGDDSDSDDDEHGWKFKGPKLPSWKFGKGQSGKSPKVSGDVDVDANLKGPDVDISGPGVESPDIKGPDLEISGPRVSGPDFDLKAKKGDESDSDDDEHGWKFKGPKLSSWEFGKGKSGKSPNVSGNVDGDADNKGPDVNISGPDVDSPNIEGADIEITSPRVSGPDIDLKAKGDHTDSDDEKHGWNFKGPKLPGWKFGKGKSGKTPKLSGDVQVDAIVEGPDANVSRPDVDTPDIKGPDFDISGPRINCPEIDLKAKKGKDSDSDSDSDDDKHGWKFKRPRLPSWKRKKEKSGKDLKLSGDVGGDANLKGPDVDISGPGVDSPGIKGPDVDISDPRIGGPEIDLKTKKGNHSDSDSDDEKHGWKFKGPKLPGWKFGKRKSEKSRNVSGDVDVDANLKGPHTDISGPGVDSPDVKGPDVDTSGPRVSGPEIDLKTNKGDHSDSDSDDEKHGWKFKAPKLPGWKFGKGKSGKSPKVSSDVDVDVNLKVPDVDISGPGVDSPGIKGRDVDISGPQVSGPIIDLKTKKGDHSDSGSDDDKHGWKLKGPKLPGWKFRKGKSGKSPKLSGDVELDASFEAPDADISRSGVDNPDLNGPDVGISGTRVSGPEIDLKTNKGDHSDSDSDHEKHGWRFKGPKLPRWKFGKGKSRKSPKVSGDVDVDANLKVPDVDILGPGVDSPGIKGPDVDMSGPRVCGPEIDLKAKESDNSDDDGHGWKLKGPKLPSWKFGTGKSGKSPNVSGDVEADANLKGPDVDISDPGVESLDIKGPNIDISGPRLSGPEIDMKVKKGDDSDSDDDEHGWKFKGPKLPSWKFGKGKSGKSPNFFGDTDVDGNLDAPDVDISGAVDMEEVVVPENLDTVEASIEADLEITPPEIPSADVTIPAISGPDIDVKSKKGDHSNSDRDGGWKFGLPDWKLGKSGEKPKAVGDVSMDGNVETPDIDISGPRMSGPEIDLTKSKGDHSDSDSDESGWKFKGPKLPSWKFGKGKSAKPPKVSGDGEIDADIDSPDLNISGGADSPDVEGPDVDISGPRLSSPDMEMKDKKGNHSDSDDDKHGRKFKGPKLPNWKCDEEKSGKSPKASGDVEIDVNLKGPGVHISEPGVDSPDIKGSDVEISDPRVTGPEIDLKAKKGDHSDSDSDDDKHSWKFKGPKLPGWKFGKGKSGKTPKVSGDVELDAGIDGPDANVSRPDVDTPDIKGPDVDILGLRISGPEIELKGEKDKDSDSDSDSDDEKHGWKLKRPRLPSWKRKKGKSGKGLKVSGDVDGDAHLKGPDVDISGPGVDSPEIKGSDVEISGPRVSGPEIDLKAKKGDHSDSDSDDDKHGWKFKGPKLPGWKFGKGKSGKTPRVSGDVKLDAGIDGLDANVSRPDVDTPDIKGPDVDISGPRISGPEIELKGEKVKDSNSDSDSDDEKHGWKLKRPRLPSWKRKKGKSGKGLKVSGDVDGDAHLKGPDVDISGPGVDSPEIKGSDVEISGPRVSGPEIDLKAKKGDHSDSDSDDDKHGWKFKGPKLPGWKFGKGKSGKTPKVSGDVELDAGIDGRDVNVSRPDVDTPDIKGPDVDISGPRISGPEIELKGEKDKDSDSDSDSDDEKHGWKLKRPRLPSWKRKKGKSGKGLKVSGDVDGDAHLKGPDVDISGPGVDSPEIKGSDVEISGPRVSGPEIDLKAKKGDHSDSDSDDDKHGWKLKGPKLPGWKFGKGKSGKTPKVSGDVKLDAGIDGLDANVSRPDVDTPDIKGPDVDISGPRISGPEIDMKGEKDKDSNSDSDSDDEKHGWKLKRPRLPSWKRKKGKSGKGLKVSGDVDGDAHLKGPDVDISGPGVDSPEIKGSDVEISGPRVSGPEIDLKAKKGDHSDSDSDDDKHGWKFKGPKLPGWKFGKGKSGKTPKVSGDVELDAGIDGPDANVSRPDVDTPDIKGPDVDISGPRISGPEIELKGEKDKDSDSDSDSDDEKHGWKLKRPRLPSWKRKKGKSGKGLKVSGDVDGDAHLKGPDVDISGPGVDSPEIKGSDVEISGPRVSGPEIDLKAKKGDHSDSDSDDDKHGWKFKGPKLPGWKFGKGKSGKTPKVSGDVELDAGIDGPDANVSRPDVDTPDIKGPDVDISGPRISGPEIELKGEKDKDSDSDSDSDDEKHGWKLKRPRLPSWKRKKGKSGKGLKVSGDVDGDAHLKGPDVDISGPGVDSPEIKGSDVEISGPRVSGPEIDLKAKKGDHSDSDSDDDKHGWKLKGPKLPGWKFGKGKSGKTPKVSGDVELDAGIDGRVANVSRPDVDTPNIKGPDVDISGPRISGPEIELKGEKDKDSDSDSDSDDEKHGWKLKRPRLPSWKRKKGKSGKGLKVSGDVDGDAHLKGPDVDISGPGVDSPEIKGSDVEISGPRVSGPEIDLKAKKGDHSDSDSDDDKHGWKLKGPKLPGWKFGKGKSGKTPKVSGDVELDAGIDGRDVNVSRPDVDTPDIKGPDVDISGPRISGPEIELKGEKDKDSDSDSDSDDEKHGWKLKRPRLPSWKRKKGKSGKGLKVSGDVDGDAHLKGPDVDISGPGVDSPEIKGSDVEISGPRVSGPEIDLKAKKGDHSDSDSDDDKHGWKFKGPKLPGWKFGKGKSGKTPKASGNVDIDGNLKGPDVHTSGPGVDSPYVKGPDVDISGTQVSGPDIELKSKRVDHSDSDSDSDDEKHGWKFKGPKLPGWKFGKKKSGKTPKLSGGADLKANLKGRDVDISGPGAESLDVKGVDVDISGPRVSRPEFDLKAKKGDHADSDDGGGWKFGLPDWKFGKSKSGKKPKAAGDVTIDGNIERPPVSGPEIDLKAKEGDQSDSDHDKHGWKFKGPKLPGWKLGKGKSKKKYNVSGDVDVDANIESPDIEISGPTVEMEDVVVPENLDTVEASIEADLEISTPDIPSADVTVPAVTSPDIDLKTKKGDQPDSDGDGGWKFRLPDWILGKGKSGKKWERAWSTFSRFHSWNVFKYEFCLQQKLKQQKRDWNYSYDINDCCKQK